MIDTIGININGYKVKESELDNIIDSVDRETGETVLRGNLGNLRIKQKGGSVSLFGSISKYYLGSNMESLDREGVGNAIEDIAKRIEIPIGEGDVYRVDVGANFVMDHPVGIYYRELGMLSRYKKSEIANKQTLLYTTSLVSIEFYDKIKEVKRRRGEIEEEYIGKNVLRYEVQFKKASTLKKRLGIKELRFGDICKEEIYNGLIRQWKEIYFSIDRVSSGIGHIESIKPKELRDALARIGLDRVSSKYLHTEIESRKGELSRMEYYRVKKLIRSLEGMGCNSNSKIIELDEKILNTK